MWVFNFLPWLSLAFSQMIYPIINLSCCYGVGSSDKLDTFERLYLWNTVLVAQTCLFLLIGYLTTCCSCYGILLRYGGLILGTVAALYWGWYAKTLVYYYVSYIAVNATMLLRLLVLVTKKFNENISIRHVISWNTVTYIYATRYDFIIRWKASQTRICLTPDKEVTCFCNERW